MQQSFDMVIVGGGIVGSALAAALADTKLSIALVETQLPFAPATDALECSDVDLRVSALNRASETFLSSINVWKSIPESRKCAYNKMRIWDGEGTGHIQFDGHDIGESHLGHIVENRYTAAALIMGVQQQKNVQLFSATTVNEIEVFNSSDNLLENNQQEKYFIHLDNGQTLYSSLIVAADGARSFVRDWADFETREWNYDHNGLVCSIETELPHEDCAWQRFTEDGVLAFLPIKSQSEKNLCSIVWSCSAAAAEKLLLLNEAEFNQQLSNAFENKLGRVLSSGARVAIPLRQRHAKSYCKNGVVLIGDAAHTIHPLAGQGVNLGLMDAYVLADEIKQGLQRGLPAHNSQLLARYERRRMPENLTMMVAMESFKRLFAVKTPGLRWLRNWGMSKINSLDMVKNHIVQEAMGLKRRIK
ncbi:MAG: 2-octaprenylphenol hydroxylase [Psychrobacter glaciei]|jgi:2-octaprenylphenol hydroxylase